MKNLVIIALSILSLSAFASQSQSNSSLNGALLDQAIAAGLTTDQALTLVITNKINQSMTAKQIVDAANDNK